MLRVNKKTNQKVSIMTRIHNREQSAVRTRTRSNRRATVSSADELMALTMMGAVAFVSVAIGAWSVLAFSGALVGEEGPLGLVSGFISAVSGL